MRFARLLSYFLVAENVKPVDIRGRYYGNVGRAGSVRRCRAITGRSLADHADQGRNGRAVTVTDEAGAFDVKVSTIWPRASRRM